jgi:hypothetical protein
VRTKAKRLHPLSPAPADGFDYMVAAGLPTLHGAIERVREIRGERGAAARARGERGAVASRDADALSVVLAAAEIVLRTAGPAPKAPKAKARS